MHAQLSSQPPLAALGPKRMPPDVVFVKLDAATRLAWIVPEGMVAWALARAQHPGRPDRALEHGDDVARLVATCRAMLDDELGGESPSPSARNPQRDPQGRLLIDSFGFERLLSGGLAGAAAAALPPTVAQALTARMRTLSRTPLRRLVTTLASDLEHGGVGRTPSMPSPLGSSQRPKHNAAIRSPAAGKNVRPKATVATRDTTRPVVLECDDTYHTRCSDGGHGATCGDAGDDCKGGTDDVAVDDGEDRDDGHDDHDDDAVVARFVRERCVRRGESCLADALYRSFVAWAPVGARAMARPNFWRAIAAHAVHGFDVDGRAHIVSGLSPSLNSIVSSKPRQDSFPRPRVTAISVSDATAAFIKSEPRHRRQPSGAKATLTGSAARTAPNAVVKAEPVDDDDEYSVEPMEGASGVSKEVRCDPATGYVAAIDLIFEAADVWGSPQGRKLASRLIYSLRQAGWNFDKRRIGPGRATPLVRAMDVDDFLNAAATFAGRDRAALTLARYSETESYMRLMTRMGQRRDPLGRRAAAIHAQACITARTAAADSVATPPPPTPTKTKTRPLCGASQEPISKSTQILLCRRNRNMGSDGVDASGPQSMELSPRSPSSKRAIDSINVNDCRRPSSRYRDHSAVPERRVRRRISVSSSSDDDGDHNEGEGGSHAQHQRQSSQGYKEEAVARDANVRGRITQQDPCGTRPWHLTMQSPPASTPPQRQPTRTHEGTTINPHTDTTDTPLASPLAARVHGARSSGDGNDNVVWHDEHQSMQRQTPGVSHGVAIKAEPADDCVDAFTASMPDEIAYNGSLVDDMAARVPPDSALCVWRRTAGVWRLLLAARPGPDRRRPWRLVGGSHAQNESAPKGGVRWIEWSKVRLTAVDLFSTSPYTVLSVDPDCEPPGDDPDADSLNVVSSWLFVACREWATGRWTASDTVMSSLALRIAETAAADPDAPHATEAVAIAKACVRRLHKNHPRPTLTGYNSAAS
ncbi:hypothetical protein pkur_cds_508 [Pandoravirus kuranda]|uniref:Uncharacterized protein n=1 Tax=Pandoravirus kuranda TaxID=3019033 RepID=A0AA95J3P8_9VIRU|nr:hypothetical protein pkur_cds_508 [Pandoravirus kuranda]